MKRVIHILLAIFASMILAGAHPYAPPRLEWLPRSDAVYLVTADSVTVLTGYATGTVKFSVIDVLRGRPQTALTLTAVEEFTATPHSKYILIHNPGGFKDQVGWTIEGDPEWWPILVTGEGSNAIAKPLGTLAEIQQYLIDHPTKP